MLELTRSYKRTSQGIVGPLFEQYGDLVLQILFISNAKMSQDPFLVNKQCRWRSFEAIKIEGLGCVRARLHMIANPFEELRSHDKLVIRNVLLDKGRNLQVNREDEDRTIFCNFINGDNEKNGPPRS